MAYAPPPNYAGDVSVTEAWDLLRQGAQLVDVRTKAEWTYVGQPDVGMPVHSIEWQSFPNMTLNSDFALEFEASVGTDKNVAVLFLCRSGVRSRAAAEAMTARGYTRCFNVAGGFEGQLDDEHHRGKLNGWKAAGLPWTQT